MMRFLKPIFRFLTRRLVTVLRVVAGVFMILMGCWFVLAPITQQFFVKADALQDSPFLWLIVPVGILQIMIGIGLFPRQKQASSQDG